MSLLLRKLHGISSNAFSILNRCTYFTFRFVRKSAFCQEYCDIMTMSVDDRILEALQWFSELRINKVLKEYEVLSIN